jgi:serine/threonine protein phosphatase 1
MRRYYIGDIHGAHLALVQVLERSGFDYQNDQLICSGDIVDGWDESKECIQVLKQVRNLILLRGNHDERLLQFVDNELCYTRMNKWLENGGASTYKSYGGEFTKEDMDFLRSAVPYHTIGDKLFIHAGMDCTKRFCDQDEHTLYHDSTMVECAFNMKNEPAIPIFSEFSEIYVGHTPTYFFNPRFTTPQKWANVWLVDTGAAFRGRLSMIDIDTKQVTQSDIVMKLYPDSPGRNYTPYNQMGAVAARH